MTNTIKKLDLKKEYKDLFNADHKSPVIITAPKLNYLTLRGKGDPNTSSEYQQSIDTLFSVSYKLKFAIKKGQKAIDYGVLPLEGLWWVENMADFDMKDKSNWLWQTMILQPDFVSQEEVDDAIEQVKKKKALPQLEQLNFEQIEEGLCVQILHIGPYEDEGPTIERLHTFMKDNGYTFNGHHHEIYLSDPRRSAPEKLKTIIRQPVRKR